jgi:hypothetical protein
VSNFRYTQLKIICLVGEKDSKAAYPLNLVFLRMIEYYNGIMFLTINRAGVLDEAIKSRVHLTLEYKPLNEEQKVEIFKLNIQRLEEVEKSRCSNDQRPIEQRHRPLVIDDEDVLEFARNHWRNNAKHDGFGRWNERKIRNAFLIAASLAHYEADNKPKLQKQLKQSHFKKVEETTLEYDKFREDFFKKSDSELVREREERPR